MQLGIIKIKYNRTSTHFMDNSFVNLGEEAILTLLWQSGASESTTVCFVISLSICYWQILREGETGSHNNRVSFLKRGLCANTYEHHHCVCHATLLPVHAWTDGKCKDIINCLFTFNLNAEARDYAEGHYIFDSCLWCSANHNALGQLANQSRLRLLD